MKRKAGEALLTHHNQYPPLLGLPELRKAIASHSEREQSVKVDWETEVLVTVGAQEAIGAAIMGLCNPGERLHSYSLLIDE